MQITTIMVVTLLIWCLLTLLLRGGADLPPLPSADNINKSEHTLGWLYGTFWAQLPAVLTRRRIRTFPAGDERFRDARPGVP